MTYPKPPLKPGDRVNVYDHIHVDKGAIVPPDNNNSFWILVKSDRDGIIRPYHPKQCRRLKAKPRPQQEGKERVERWITVVEVREGERVVSREDLAKAWDEMFKAQGMWEFSDSSTSNWFQGLCKALGLESRTTGEGLKK